MYKVTRCRRRSTGKGRPERAFRLIPEVVKMLAGVIVEEEFDKEQELWYSRKELEHDLHLAAELGKTLLERNHDLEQGLQEMYSTNQEQLQEIEYLNKQVELLRQMNDQHTKMYEQLDVAARDLETTNHRLVLDNRTAQGKILRRLSSESHSDDLSWWALDAGQVEEEKSALQSALRSLHTQLGTERERREAAEKVMELTERENRALEERLAQLERTRRHQAELEAEVEELRQLWRSETPSVRPTDSLVADDVIFLAEEEKGAESGVEVVEEEEGSEQEPRRGHELTCIRRSEAVRQRGISLLNEVDAQYSVLKTKYEELLLRCQRGDRAPAHKAVQTPGAALETRSTSLTDDSYQPEYRALFKEIFTCIQKTKEDLSENRATPRATPRHKQ
ncbi:cerebellar degeneration-related protein 2 isoform X3 [Ictalurus furcatus]|uniref:cerebellar degeneration-related protein 2 isoform X3 n=1 Tax=Ictalurus furcatus TaxID=66913 RepID=UPI00235048D2|nr:cerebellar degeneration-related protein 2 isoform X3 [Ictalurus furcatus]